VPRGDRQAGPAAPGFGFRFYLDEDVPAGAAEVARGLGLDVVSAREVGPTPQPDGVHLALAAAQGRIVVSYNRDDFIELTRDAFAAGRPHAGVLILTHKLPRDGARVAHALLRWAAGAAERFGPPLQPYLVDFLSH
jgi:predicted nuclease of predicted toxin-antitoxin system